MFGSPRLYSVILFLKVEQDLSGLPIDICFHNFSTYMYTYIMIQNSQYIFNWYHEKHHHVSLFTWWCFFASIVTLHEFVFFFHRRGSCLQVACGHSHSLALVQNEESLKEHVYSWGLGSSGQLGLPKEQLQDN